jgi:CBS domain-containing protein
LNDQKVSAQDLILEEMIPLAEEGLKSRNVDTGDIDKYLGVIKERTKKHTTGARWMLRSFTDLIDKVPRDEAVSILTATMVKNQEESRPVHEWQLPGPADLAQYQPSRLKVEEFMITDVFTAQADDIVQFVCEMMLWRKIRHLPIEDNKGKLVGLVSSRTLLRHMTDQKKSGSKKVVSISEIMIKDPITIHPEANILDAMRLMSDNKIGCLPVCNGSELVGIITEKDFLRVSSRLMERLS